MSSLPTTVNNLLVCIYTCEKHRGMLRQFHASILGQYLKGLDGAKILEVYADPDIHHSTHNGNELVLRTQEKYGALSSKTYKMIDYCVQIFDFQYLLKIDVATVRTLNIEPEYVGREPTDLNKLIDFLKDSSFDKDYDGFALFQNIERISSENWAAKKGGVINWGKLFGDSTHLPPFYRGQCYVVSKRFAQYISQHGQEMAEEHEKYFLGSEDVMIGRLYDEFRIQGRPPDQEGADLKPSK